MPNIKIDAVTVPVVVAFTAQPGDVLLLVNGVCVGLQHAEHVIERIDVAPAPWEVEVDEDVSEPSVAKAVALRIPAESVHGGRLKHDDARILVALRELQQPVKAADVLNRLRLRDQQQRILMGQRLKRLVDRGEIKRLDQNGERPRYVIAER